MFNIVIIYICSIGIIRRIDIDALYLSGEFALQCLQCQQIISVD